MGEPGSVAPWYSHKQEVRMVTNSFPSPYLLNFTYLCIYLFSFFHAVIFLLSPFLIKEVFYFLDPMVSVSACFIPFFLLGSFLSFPSFIFLFFFPLFFIFLKLISSFIFCRFFLLTLVYCSVLCTRIYDVFFFIYCSFISLSINTVKISQCQYSS